MATPIPAKAVLEFTPRPRTLPLTTPDPLNPVLAHLPPSCLQQRGDAAVAVASVLRRQGDDGAGQRILVSWHGGHVALRAPVLANDPAGMAF